VIRYSSVSRSPFSLGKKQGKKKHWAISSREVKDLKSRRNCFKSKNVRTLLRDSSIFNPMSFTSRLWVLHLPCSNLDFSLHPFGSSAELLGLSLAPSRSSKRGFTSYAGQKKKKKKVSFVLGKRLTNGRNDLGNIIFENVIAEGDQGIDDSKKSCNEFVVIVLARVANNSLLIFQKGSAPVSQFREKGKFWPGKAEDFGLRFKRLGVKSKVKKCKYLTVWSSWALSVSKSASSSQT